MKLVLNPKEANMPYVWSGGTQTAARFLIDNVTGVDMRLLATLADACVIDPDEMNRRINTQLEILLDQLPSHTSPLVLYPGNGANQLRGRLSRVKDLPSLGVPAKRYWQPGITPVCEVQVFSIPEDVTHCLVADDVISSGGTMCAIRENIPEHVECWAVSQVSQRLVARRKKVLHGFNHIIVGSELCGDAVSYVPINSVSTFCASRDIAESYAKRNIRTENQTHFLSLL